MTSQTFAVFQAQYRSNMTTQRRHSVSRTGIVLDSYPDTSSLIVVSTVFPYHLAGYCHMMAWSSTLTSRTRNRKC
ncbi:hypothetical protein BJ165DRAFT_1483504 [Panaeolus papilionaceus]|nr:hypothetical protein BJ165DRAFT_1483504 [Panaeolus papilionaceus]